VERGVEIALPSPKAQRFRAGKLADFITTLGDTMTAYLIVDTALHNPERYEDYKRLARPLAERFGGEYLARGGEMTLKEADLWSPARLVLVKFPDAQSANAFYHSPEYQAILPISQESARRTVVLVEGL
jgi:uncharacterized protein (DUF1330 family)